MSRRGYHQFELWQSIKRLDDVGFLDEIRDLSSRFGLVGNYYDEKKPATDQAVRLMRRQGAHARWIKRYRDACIIVVYLPDRPPVSGTVKGFYWRLYS